jgi:hypothetical protein
MSELSSTAVRNAVIRECARVALDMALEQEATNAMYPDHAAAYESWRVAPHHYRTVADNLIKRIAPTSSTLTEPGTADVPQEG